SPPRTPAAGRTGGRDGERQERVVLRLEREGAVVADRLEAREAAAHFARVFEGRGRVDSHPGRALCPSATSRAPELASPDAPGPRAPAPRARLRARGGAAGCIGARARASHRRRQVRESRRSALARRAARGAPALLPAPRRRLVLRALGGARAERQRRDRKSVV